MTWNTHLLFNILSQFVENQDHYLSFIYFTFGLVINLVHFYNLDIQILPISQDKSALMISLVIHSPLKPKVIIKNNISKHPRILLILNIDAIADNPLPKSAILTQIYVFCLCLFGEKLRNSFIKLQDYFHILRLMPKCSRETKEINLFLLVNSLYYLLLTQTQFDIDVWYCDLDSNFN